MKTNRPAVIAWEVRTLSDPKAQLGSSPSYPKWAEGNADLIITPLVSLSDYEAMQSAYEEELFLVRQDRDTHFGTVVRAIEQIAKMEEECEKLRKDAEFGRSVLSKREPGKVYGCHCDPEEGIEPDECVVDEGMPHHCVDAAGFTLGPVSDGGMDPRDRQPAPAAYPQKGNET